MKLLSLSTMTVAMTITTLAASAAFAAKSNTEYYFQPANGQSAVELRYIMDVSPRQTQTAPAAAVDNGRTETNDVSLNYAYGLNESNTLGAALLTGSTKYTSSGVSSTGSGLGDFHLFYKGSADIWHYGVDLGINTEKIKQDATTGNQSNHTTGGLSAKAFVGVMMNSGATNYGADLSYLMPFERTVDVTNVKIKDGNIIRLAPFAEYNYGMGFLGAELSYAVAADTNITAVNTSTTTAKGDTQTGLNLYGSFDFNEMATGLLNVGMVMHGEHDATSVAGTTVKAYTETIASLGVRLNF